MSLPLALLLVLLSTAFAGAESSPARADCVFEKAAARDDRFALGVARADGEGEPFVRVAGPVRRGASRPVGREAPWHVGSITKSFTATLVLQAVDRGELSLDAPIDGYLERHASEMHPDWRELTLRELLSHTAGLPADAPLWHRLRPGAGGPGRDRLAVLGALWGRPSSGTPGDFVYSNVGYVLAGLVMEEVTGEAWEDLVGSRIAGPLGLTSLGFGPPRGAEAPWGHRSTLGPPRPVDPADRWADNPPWMRPAGGLHMSLADLAAWGRAHLRACAGDGSDALLSPEGCRAMRAPVSDGYGLGWAVRRDAGVGGPLV